MQQGSGCMRAKKLFYLNTDRKSFSHSISHCCHAASSWKTNIEMDEDCMLRTNRYGWLCQRRYRNSNEIIDRITLNMTATLKWLSKLIELPLFSLSPWAETKNSVRVYSDSLFHFTLNCCIVEAHSFSGDNFDIKSTTMFESLSKRVNRRRSKRRASSLTGFVRVTYEPSGDT